MTHAQLKVKALTQPTVKAEYDNLSPEFNLIREKLLARKNAGISQPDISDKMDTKIMNVE